MFFNFVVAFGAGVAAASQNVSDIPWQCNCDEIDVPEGREDLVEHCNQQLDIIECTQVIRLAEAVGFKDYPLDHPQGYDIRRSGTIGCLGCWPGLVPPNRIFWSGLGLQGTIPAFIGEMTWSTHLDLSNNSLTGPIPDMPLACDLYLGHNKLSGGYPSGSWPELWRMFLNDNQLTGNLPQGLDKSMPKLRRMDISNNQFTGEIPRDMSIWDPSIGCDLCQLGGNQWNSSIPLWWMEEMEDPSIWQRCCYSTDCLGDTVI